MLKVTVHFRDCRRAAHFILARDAIEQDGSRCAALLLVAMVLSVLQRAKRAFVFVLLATASAVGLALNVTRESEDKALTAAYRKVVLKAHPDKGGCKRSFQKLQGAKEAWDAARKQEVPSGRPESRNNSQEGLVTLPTKTEDAEHRVRGVAVLLTYFGDWSLALWQEFLAFVRGRLKAWSGLRWTP